MKADRRLALTRDRSRVVDAGTPEARYLLAEEGQEVPRAEVRRLGLEVEAGRVVQTGKAKKGTRKKGR